MCYLRFRKLARAGFWKQICDHFIFWRTNFAGGRDRDARVTERNEWQAALCPRPLSSWGKVWNELSCRVQLHEMACLCAGGQTGFWYLSEGGRATRDELWAASVQVVFITGNSPESILPLGQILFRFHFLKRMFWKINTSRAVNFCCLWSQA